MCVLGRTDEGMRSGQSLVVNLGLSGGRNSGVPGSQSMTRGEKRLQVGVPLV